jgi:methyl-accepting chemotaxis protein
MKIFLNTRGESINNDYKWFDLTPDNKLSESSNYWKDPIISRIPNSTDFTIVFGKGIEAQNKNFFLFIANLKSSRRDKKEREIRNTLILQSNNETFLKKIAFSLYHNYNFNGEQEISKLVDKTIIADKSKQYELSYDFEKLKNIFKKISDQEIDNLIEISHYSHEAKKYYRISKLTLENKEKTIDNLKESLFYEQVPNNSIIFVFLPFVTLEEINKFDFYITIALQFDKVGEKEVLKDTEEWAVIQTLKEPLNFSKILKNKEFLKVFMCMLLISISVFIYKWYSDIDQLTSEIEQFNADNLRLKVQNQKLLEDSYKYKNSSLELSENIKSLEQNLSELVAINQELMQNIKELESNNNELKELQKNRVDKDELKELKRINKAYLNRIYTLKWERNKYRNQLNKLKSK